MFSRDFWQREFQKALPNFLNSSGAQDPVYMPRFPQHRLRRNALIRVYFDSPRSLYCANKPKDIRFSVMVPSFLKLEKYVGRERIRGQ